MDQIDTTRLTFGFFKLPKKMDNLSILDDLKDSLLDSKDKLRSRIINGDNVVLYILLEPIFKISNFIPICLLVKDDDGDNHLVFSNIGKAKSFEFYGQDLTNLMMRCSDHVAPKYHIGADDKDIIAIAWNDPKYGEIGLVYDKENCEALLRDDSKELARYKINEQYDKILKLAETKPDTDLGDMLKETCRVCFKSSILKQCSKCCEVIYCSRECQIEDWKYHKKQCKPKITKIK